MNLLRWCMNKSDYKVTLLSYSILTKLMVLKEYQGESTIWGNIVADINFGQYLSWSDVIHSNIDFIAIYWISFCCLEVIFKSHKCYWLLALTQRIPPKMERLPLVEPRIVAMLNFSTYSTRHFSLLNSIFILVRVRIKYNWSGMTNGYFSWINTLGVHWLVAENSLKNAIYSIFWRK